MTEIEVKAIEGLNLLKQGDNRGAYRVFVQAYNEMKYDVAKLNDITHFAEVGAAFASLLTFNQIDDIDVQQRVASISYLFLSKAIKQSHERKELFIVIENLYGYRIILVENYGKALSYTAMEALNIDGGVFGAGMAHAEASDALGAMQYYDLRHCPTLIERSSFYSNMKDAFERSISGNNPLGIKKSPMELVERGQNHHTRMLEYLENKVLKNEDINF